MLRLLPISFALVFIASCSPNHHLDADNIASLVSLDSNLKVLKLEYSHREIPPDQRIFIGTAQDSEGFDYYLFVEATREEVHWLATPMIYISSIEEAEWAVTWASGLKKVVLTEERAERYEGRGSDDAGQNYTIHARTKYNEQWMYQEKRRFAIELFDASGRCIQNVDFASSKSGIVYLP